MWDRKDLKARAKNALKLNYWRCVLVAFVMFAIVGGGLASGGSKVHENININLPESQTQGGSITIDPEDPDSIVGMDLDELGGMEDLTPAQVQGLIDAVNDSHEPPLSAAEALPILAILGGVLAVVMLMVGIYASGDGGMDYEFLVQVCALVLIVYLLWRVETLQDLSISQIVLSEEIAGPVPDDIECLLRQHCEVKQLYLQRDLTVSQLAQALGINRFYLSQYFSRKKTTYNTYINELRINHFIGLYREAVSAGRPVSAKLLAGRSGYRSYSTFSLAFKQYTGFSVTNWMYKESGSFSVGASAATPSLPDSLE